MDNLLGAVFSKFASFMVDFQLFFQKQKDVVIGLVIIFLLLGFVVGRILPVEWVNATPANLREDFRYAYYNYVAQEYVASRDQQMVINRLGLDLPKRYLPWKDATALQAELDAAQTDATQFNLNAAALQELNLALPGIWTLAREAPPEATPVVEPGEPAPEVPVEEEGGLSMTTLIIIFVVLLVLGAIIFVLLRQFRSSGETTDIAEPDLYDTDVATRSPSQVTPAPEGFEGEPPVKSFTTTYVLGDDYFDPSFSIEIGSDFLGECGVGISETIGTGDPKKVTAFEAWLFDKSDIRTVTTVLASEYAHNDPDLRSKLAPKGDVVQLKEGTEIILETSALRIRAYIKELEYAQGNLPSKSFVQQFSVELQAWVKSIEQPDFTEQL